LQETVDLREFVGGFIAESDQLVASATAGLLEIEQANVRGELKPKTVRDLFRALHTLKGLAGMMGVHPIVDLAHSFETVVRAADQSGGRLGARAVELGLLALRAIADRVRAVCDRGRSCPRLTCSSTSLRASTRWAAPRRRRRRSPRGGITGCRPASASSSPERSSAAATSTR
jgi:two-component system, chemotaxis family, sensor kinase CheA